MNNKILFDKLELNNKYLELQTIANTAIYFNVSESVIRKNLKNFSIPLNNINWTRNRNKKFQCNESFFDVDSPESFYIAGFIAADGNIQKQTNTLTIGVSTLDVDHLHVINKLLQSDRMVRSYKNHTTGLSLLRISSKQIINTLNEKFNIVPNKSLIYTFPSFVKNHKYKSHFMRGYFDGDGSFYLNEQYNKKVCFGLRGTSEFLLEYRNIIEKECDFKIRTNPIPISNNCGQLCYGGNKNIVKISNFLYKDDTICLNRKKELSLLAQELYVNS